MRNELAKFLSVEEVFVTKSFTVAHEVEAIAIVSQPDENRTNAQNEPAHNGQISMRSPSSNAKQMGKWRKIFVVGS